MKERSLIVFTILSQMAVGTFWTLGALYVWSTRQAGPGVAHELTSFGWPAISLVMGTGVVASFFHLGTRANAWRAFRSLSRSWLSREILFAVLFAGASTLLAVMQRLEWGTSVARDIIGVLAGLIGLALIFTMGSAYRLRTIPAWNTWVTPASFFVTAFLLGALAAGALLIFPSKAPAEWTRIALQRIAVWAVILLGIELIIVPLWLSQLTGSEAATSSFVRITKKHGAIFKLRLALAVAGIAAASAALLEPCEGCLPTQGFSVLAALGLVLASEVLGRWLFYVARVRHGV